MGKPNIKGLGVTPRSVSQQETYRQLPAVSPKAQLGTGAVVKATSGSNLGQMAEALSGLVKGFGDFMQLQAHYSAIDETKARIAAANGLPLPNQTSIFGAGGKRGYHQGLGITKGLEYQASIDDMTRGDNITAFIDNPESPNVQQSLINLREAMGKERRRIFGDNPNIHEIEGASKSLLTANLSAEIGLHKAIKDTITTNTLNNIYDQAMLHLQSPSLNDPQALKDSFANIRKAAKVSGAQPNVASAVIIDAINDRAQEISSLANTSTDVDTINASIEELKKLQKVLGLKDTKGGLSFSTIKSKDGKYIHKTQALSARDTIVKNLGRLITHEDNVQKLHDLEAANTLILEGYNRHSSATEVTDRLMQMASNKKVNIGNLSEMLKMVHAANTRGAFGLSKESFSKILQSVDTGATSANNRSIQKVYSAVKNVLESGAYNNMSPTEQNIFNKLVSTSISSIKANIAEKTRVENALYKRNRELREQARAAREQVRAQAKAASDKMKEDAKDMTDALTLAALQQNYTGLSADTKAAIGRAYASAYASKTPEQRAKFASSLVATLKEEADQRDTFLKSGDSFAKDTDAVYKKIVDLGYSASTFNDTDSLQRAAEKFTTFLKNSMSTKPIVKVKKDESITGKILNKLHVDTTESVTLQEPVDYADRFSALNIRQKANVFRILVNNPTLPRTEAVALALHDAELVGASTVKPLLPKETLQDKIENTASATMRTLPPGTDYTSPKTTPVSTGTANVPSHITSGTVKIPTRHGINQWLTGSPLITNGVYLKDKQKEPLLDKIIHDSDTKLFKSLYGKDRGRRLLSVAANGIIGATIGISRTVREAEGYTVVGLSKLLGIPLTDKAKYEWKHGLFLGGSDVPIQDLTNAVGKTIGLDAPKTPLEKMGADISGFVFTTAIFNVFSSLLGTALVGASALSKTAKGASKLKSILGTSGKLLQSTSKLEQTAVEGGSYLSKIAASAKLGALASVSSDYRDQGHIIDYLGKSFKLGTLPKNAVLTRHLAGIAEFMSLDGAFSLLGSSFRMMKKLYTSISKASPETAESVLKAAHDAVIKKGLNPINLSKAEVEDAVITEASHKIYTKQQYYNSLSPQKELSTSSKVHRRLLTIELKKEVAPISKGELRASQEYLSNLLSKTPNKATTDILKLPKEEALAVYSKAKDVLSSEEEKASFKELVEKEVIPKEATTERGFTTVLYSEDGSATEVTMRTQPPSTIEEDIVPPTPETQPVDIDPLDVVEAEETKAIVEENTLEDYIDKSIASDFGTKSIEEIDPIKNLKVEDLVTQHEEQKAVVDTLRKSFELSGNMDSLRGKAERIKNKLLASYSKTSDTIPSVIPNAIKEELGDTVLSVQDNLALLDLLRRKLNHAGNLVGNVLDSPSVYSSGTPISTLKGKLKNIRRGLKDVLEFTKQAKAEAVKKGNSIINAESRLRNLQETIDSLANTTAEFKETIAKDEVAPIVVESLGDKPTEDAVAIISEHEGSDVKAAVETMQHKIEKPKAAPQAPTSETLTKAVETLEPLPEELIKAEPEILEPTSAMSEEEKAARELWEKDSILHNTIKEKITQDDADYLSFMGRHGIIGRVKDGTAVVRNLFNIMKNKSSNGIPHTIIDKTTAYPQIRPHFLGDRSPLYLAIKNEATDDELRSIASGFKKPQAVKTFVESVIKYRKAVEDTKDGKAIATAIRKAATFMGKHAPRLADKSTPPQLIHILDGGSHFKQKPTDLPGFEHFTRGAKDAIQRAFDTLNKYDIFGSRTIHSRHGGIADWLLFGLARSGIGGVAGATYGYLTVPEDYTPEQKRDRISTYFFLGALVGVGLKQLDVPAIIGKRFGKKEAEFLARDVAYNNTMAELKDNLKSMLMKFTTLKNQATPEGQQMLKDMSKRIRSVLYGLTQIHPRRIARAFFSDLKKTAYETLLPKGVKDANKFFSNISHSFINRLSNKGFGGTVAKGEELFVKPNEDAFLRNPSRDLEALTQIFETIFTKQGIDKYIDSDEMAKAFSDFSSEYGVSRSVIDAQGTPRKKLAFMQAVRVAHGNINKDLEEIVNSKTTGTGLFTGLGQVRDELEKGTIAFPSVARNLGYASRFVENMLKLANIHKVLSSGTKDPQLDRAIFSLKKVAYTFRILKNLRGLSEDMNQFVSSTLKDIEKTFDSMPTVVTALTKPITPQSLHRVPRDPSEVIEAIRNLVPSAEIGKEATYLMYKFTLGTVPGRLRDVVQNFGSSVIEIGDLVTSNWFNRNSIYRSNVPTKDMLVSIMRNVPGALRAAMEAFLDPQVASLHRQEASPALSKALAYFGEGMNISPSATLSFFKTINDALGKSAFDFLIPIDIATSHLFESVYREQQIHIAIMNKAIALNEGVVHNISNETWEKARASVMANEDGALDEALYMADNRARGIASQGDIGKGDVGNVTGIKDLLSSTKKNLWSIDSFTGSLLEIKKRSTPGNFFAPILDTEMKLAKRALEHMPGGNLLLSESRAIIKNAIRAYTDPAMSEVEKEAAKFALNTMKGKILTGTVAGLTMAYALSQLGDIIMDYKMYSDDEQARLKSMNIGEWSILFHNGKMRRLEDLGLPGTLAQAALLAIKGVASYQMLTEDKHKAKLDALFLALGGYAQDVWHIILPSAVKDISRLVNSSDTSPEHGGKGLMKLLSRRVKGYANPRGFTTLIDDQSRKRSTQDLQGLINDFASVLGHDPNIQNTRPSGYPIRTKVDPMTGARQVVLPKTLEDAAWLRLGLPWSKAMPPDTLGNTSLHPFEDKVWKDQFDAEMNKHKDIRHTIAKYAMSDDVTLREKAKETLASLINRARTVASSFVRDEILAKQNK